MERNDFVATARWADAYRRIEAKHTRNDGADADSPSARNGGGRNTSETRQKEHSATRLLFDFALRHDARASSPGNV